MSNSKMKQRIRQICRALEGLSYKEAKMILNQALKESGIEQPKYNKRLKVFFSSAEIDALKGYMPEVFPHPHTRRVMGMLMELWGATGVRLNASLNIEVSRISLEKKQIILGINKNGKPQILPLPDSLLPTLRMYIEGLPQGQKYLFEKPGGGIYTNRAIQANLARFRGAVMEKTGKNLEGLTAHAFRRMAGSELAAAGMDIFNLAGLFNHSDPRITMREYIEQNPLIIQRALTEANYKRALNPAGI